MEALETKSNDDQKLQTLLMNEKAINLLKRRFDRFKVNQFYDNLYEIKKLLNIEKMEYGIQLLDKKFIL
jgi:hypothetical protein